jgi:hypothetical protein
MRGEYLSSWSVIHMSEVMRAGSGAPMSSSRRTGGRASIPARPQPVRQEDLSVLLEGPLPCSITDAYRDRHPLIAWVTKEYPQSGDAWERQLRYALSHARDVQDGRLSVERFHRVLTAIARDPEGRRHGPGSSNVTPAADLECLPAQGAPPKRTGSFGPSLVSYVSSAVGWQLPLVITSVLEESTDLLVDLACRVAETRSQPFDMAVLVARPTWGRWRASSVLGHLPDRTRRSVEHILCGHPKAPKSSAIHLMHTTPASELPLEVVAFWRGDLPGLHPEVQATYDRGAINRARLGTPPTKAEITEQRAAHLVSAASRICL